MSDQAVRELSQHVRAALEDYGERLQRAEAKLDDTPSQASVDALIQMLTELEQVRGAFSKRLDEIERTLVANNIHPPMPGHPSPADE